MKIAIVTVAIDAYRKFIPDFINSIKQYVFIGEQVDIMVISDALVENYNTLVVDTLPPVLYLLLKYTYINKFDVEPYDYVYYLDSDCRVIADIGPDILPDNELHLVGVQHPWQKSDSTSFESNPLSTACIRDNRNMPYFQSCFFGGKREAFRQMTLELERNTHIDLKNRIVAKWYDESHLNRYFFDHPPKALHMGYAYPDPSVWNQVFDAPAKILHLNHGSIVKAHSYELLSNP